MPIEHEGEMSRVNTLDRMLRSHFKNVVGFDSEPSYSTPLASRPSSTRGFAVYVKRGLFGKELVAKCRFPQYGIERAWIDLRIEVLSAPNMSEARSFGADYERLTGKRVELIRQF